MQKIFHCNDIYCITYYTQLLSHNTYSNNFLASEYFKVILSDDPIE